MIVLANSQALAPASSVQVNGSGGTAPYTYSVLAGGAGGTISPSGKYTAPNTLDEDPTKNIDTIEVTDALLATAQIQISVRSPVELLCDIISKELGISADRVWVWNQKIKEPTDSDLYVVIHHISDKVFGNKNAFDPDGNEVQSVNIQSVLQIDIKSRGNSAKYRKEEVPMALNSAYAQNQQKLNSFFISTQPSQIVAVNTVDGAAIPYHFTFTLAVQYFRHKTKGVPYFDTFSIDEILIDP